VAQSYKQALGRYQARNRSAANSGFTAPRHRVAGLGPNAYVPPRCTDALSQKIPA